LLPAFAVPLALLRGSRSFALALAALSLTVPAAALAHGPASTPAIVVPPAPPGDGATAEKLLAEIESKTKAQGDAARKVVAEPVQAARKSLERAHGARVSGDAAHARMLEGLALEWAETARDLQRGATAEGSAFQLAKKARAVATQADRARALLSETQDRRGRAAAELERLEAEARKGSADAAAAEEKRIQKKTGVPGAKPAGVGSDKSDKSDKKTSGEPGAKPDKKPGASDPTNPMKAAAPKTPADPKAAPKSPKGAPKKGLNQ
jgi:hypothetical protein